MKTTLVLISALLFSSAQAFSMEMSGTVSCTGEFNASIKVKPFNATTIGVDNERVTVVSLSIPSEKIELSNVLTTADFQQGGDTPIPSLDISSADGVELSLLGAYPEQNMNTVSIAKTGSKIFNAQCTFIFTHSAEE